jgi:hypothetical protein
MQVWDMLLLGSPQFRLGSKLKKKKKSAKRSGTKVFLDLLRNYRLLEDELRKVQELCPLKENL